ncbi:MAG: hypothetical protein AABY22_18795, partial [Nanoarchaeota archaeon]
IYKYQIPILNENEIEISGLIKVLSIVEQYENPVLYALVDKEDKKLSRIRVIILGTGHDARKLMDKEWKFISTLKFHDGDLMFHFFIKEE